MSTLTALASGAALVALAAQAVTCAIAAWQCRPGRGRAVAAARPPVSIVRPVCGIDHAATETLESTFHLSYPVYEIIFCVSDAADPVVPLVERLISANPGRPARLLAGRDRYPFNPKLDNCAKGWEAARHDWIVMSDSNLMLPPDYLDRIMARAEASTGIVSAPPIGGETGNFWAEVEAGVLNTYQARIQYAVDACGLGFAQGKTLAMRRSVLDRAGGYAAMGTEAAEDAAATKAVRRLGLNVRLARPPFMQPLGVRSALSVWARQVRWARLRRATFPLLFAPEILSGLLAPLLLLAAACHGAGWPMLPVLLGFAVAWYGCEAALARIAGWPLTARSPMAWLVRDAALPAVWFAAWAGRSFSWRGQSLEAVASQSTRPGMSPAE
jgi:ceramide glucosyltransferase